jgi:hypothetical protein
MTREQKAAALRAIALVQGHLQELEAWKNPRAQTIEERREKADWQLGFLLDYLKEALPSEVRAGVQTCLDLNKHIWSACSEPEQKETSPECLAATDSF